MDNDGAKRLASVIVLQAVRDLDSAHKKTMRLHKDCRKCGECSTEFLTDYLVKLGGRGQYNSLPFEKDYERSAVRFFAEEKEWRETLFELCGILSPPEEFKDKIILLEMAMKECIPCIAKCKKYATRRLKNERELRELNDAVY